MFDSDEDMITIREAVVQRVKEEVSHVVRKTMGEQIRQLVSKTMEKLSEPDNFAERLANEIRDVAAKYMVERVKRELHAIIDKKLSSPSTHGQFMALISEMLMIGKT